VIFGDLIQTRRLEKRVAAVAARISTMDVECDTLVEAVTDELVIRLRTFVWAERVEAKLDSIPLDWREALKERFAPAWLKARRPVRYRDITATLHVVFPDYRPPSGLGAYTKYLTVTEVRPQFASN
jgi:hypothetical protein